MQELKELGVKGILNLCTLGRGEVNVILKSVITRSTQRLQCTPLSESVAPKAVGAARDQIGDRFDARQHYNYDFKSSRRVTISQDNISFVHHTYTSSTDNRNNKQVRKKKPYKEWRNLWNLDS